jgi:23S rRNA (adenine2030-N6)-methyltransferase
MRGDKRAKVVAIDGYTALNAYVPPKERRGLVLIDPPFEQVDEVVSLAQGLAGAQRKWPTGIYALWYPIKDARESESFARRLARLGIPRILRAELMLPARANARRQRALRSTRLDPPRELRSRRRAAAGVCQRKPRIGWLTGESDVCGGAPLPAPRSCFT